MAEHGKIGKYQVQGEVGRGGFGVVYRAVDPSMGRVVAIKKLTALDDPDLLTRFRNEAAAAGSLHHPNIVTIYDYGDDQGTPYIVMEFLAGTDLDQLLSRGKQFTMIEKARIMTQVAAGLDCAHRSGVVHRDIKPANIMVLEDGSVKLMDFGIALLTNQARTRLTGVGNLIGTFRYMAPEHFRGEETGTWSDLFSYGTIYYELLTGKHPFQAAEPPAIMFKIMMEDPAPIRSLMPEVPEALAHVVHRALVKDRAQRYPSMEEVLLDMKPILVDMERAHAAKLAATARSLLEQRRFDDARPLLREALALDPGQREARQLREWMNRHTTQPSSQGLIQAGEAHLARHEYEQALRAFESALKLNEKDTFLQQRVQHVRNLTLERQRAMELIEAAQRELAAGRLDAAKQKVAEGLRHTPEDAALRRLQDDVDAAQRRQNELEQVDELVGKGALAEARALLVRLEEASPGLPEVQERRERVAARETQQLNERRDALLNKIKEHLDQGQLDEAAKLLQEGRREFPRDARWTALTTALEQAQRKEALQAKLREAEQLLKAGDLEACRTLLGELSREYGTEPGLRNLEAALSAKMAERRKQAVETEVARLKRLQAAGRVGEVLLGATQLLTDHPGDAQAIALVEWANHTLEATRPIAIHSTVGAAPARAPVPVLVPAEEPRSRRILAAAVAAGLVVIAVVAFFLMRPANQPETARLSADPGSLAFELQAGGGSSLPLLSAISGVPAGQTITVRTSKSWLTGIVSEGGVQIAVDPANLTAGTYQESIFIQTSSQDRSVTIPVRVRITTSTAPPNAPALPAISFSARRLQFSYQEGQEPRTPISLQIAAGPGTPFRVQARAGESWLTVSPNAGTTPAVLQVSARPGLASGRYEALLVVSAEGVRNSPQLVEVDLMVTPRPPAPSAAPPPAAPATPPPSAAQQATPEPAVTTQNYRGAPSGSFGWQGVLEPNKPLSIDTSVRVQGERLPGLPVEITRVDPPGVRVVTPPSPSNGWQSLTVRNETDTSVEQIQFRWRLKSP